MKPQTERPFPGGLLFDKDGTLIDFQATWTPVIREAAYHAAAQDADLAKSLMVIGGHDPEARTTKPGSVLAAGTTAELAEVWGAHLAHEAVDRLTEELELIFQEEGLKNASPVGALRPLFAQLSAQRFTIGLATSDSERAAEMTLKHLGLREHFHFVCGYDSGHGVKPEPGMIEAFCRTHELSPAEVMMIGDNTHDLEMARAAGAIAVGVLSGTGREQDLAPLADHLLGSILELPRLLETQSGRESVSQPLA